MLPDEPGRRLSAVLSSRSSPPPPSASPHSRGIPNDREITAHLYQFTGCLFIKAHSRVPFTILPLRTSRIALPSPSRHPRSVADYPASPPRRSDSVSLVSPKRFRRLVKNNIKSTSLTSHHSFLCLSFETSLIWDSPWLLFSTGESEIGEIFGPPSISIRHCLL